MVASGSVNARYYDPVIGRFYSNDPIDAVSHLSNEEGIRGFNRYSYAVNNPYKYTDPDGKAICGGLCVAAVAVVLYSAYEGYQDGGATGAVAEASGYNDAVDSVNSLTSGDYSGAAVSAAAILLKPIKLADKIIGKTGLDETGKMHGDLPNIDDLKQLDNQTLSDFRDDLNTSLVKRKQVSKDLGADAGHSRRENAEADLTKQLDKHLGGN